LLNNQTTISSTPNIHSTVPPDNAEWHYSLKMPQIIVSPSQTESQFSSQSPVPLYSEQQSNVNSGDHYIAKFVEGVGFGIAVISTLAVAYGIGNFMLSKAEQKVLGEISGDVNTVSAHLRFAAAVIQSIRREYHKLVENIDRSTKLLTGTNSRVFGSQRDKELQVLDEKKKALNKQNESFDLVSELHHVVEAFEKILPVRERLRIFFARQQIETSEGRDILPKNLFPSAFLENFNITPNYTLGEFLKQKITDRFSKYEYTPDSPLVVFVNTDHTFYPLQAMLGIAQVPELKEKIAAGQLLLIHGSNHELNNFKKFPYYRYSYIPLNENFRTLNDPPTRTFDREIGRSQVVLLSSSNINNYSFLKLERHEQGSNQVTISRDDIIMPQGVRSYQLGTIIVKMKQNTNRRDGSQYYSVFKPLHNSVYFPQSYAICPYFRGVNFIQTSPDISLGDIKVSCEHFGKGNKPLSELPIGIAVNYTTRHSLNPVNDLQQIYSHLDTTRESTIVIPDRYPEEKNSTFAVKAAMVMFQAVFTRDKNIPKSYSKLETKIRELLILNWVRSKKSDPINNVYTYTENNGYGSFRPFGSEPPEGCVLIEK
jgi:hypothetical protein